MTGKLALLLTLLPVLGFCLARAFPGEHALSALGPALIAVSFPLSAIESVVAFRRAPDRFYAWAAVLLSVLEILALIAAVGLFMFAAPVQAGPAAPPVAPA